MIFWNCYSNKIVMAMRVGKETYYMAAIYLAPFYLLVCVYILLRSLHWFQVLHTVFRNVWVCRGIGLVYLFVVAVVSFSRINPNDFAPTVILEALSVISAPFNP